MRIAGGVLLIIVAVINLVVGLGYLTGGALVGGGSKLAASVAQMAEEEARKSGKPLSAEQKANLAQLNDATSKAGVPSASTMMGLGGYLLVVVGISIAAAVQLFRRKGAKFIMVAAILVAAAEVLGALMSSFGAMNIPGLLAAVFAFLGARSIGAKPAAVGAPAPM